MLLIKRLYNVMSLALEKAINSINEREFERLRNIDPDYEKIIVEELKSKFPDMFDKNTRNVAEISEYRLMDTSLVQDLETYLEVSENKEELVFLVKCLDCFLEDTIYGCIPVDQEQYRFQCLNDNVCACHIFLLPRIPCNWEHRNRDAYTSYDINFYMRNFYFVQEKDMNNYRAEHILMPKNLFKEAVRRKELRIAVSPVTKEKVVEATEPYLRDHARFVAVRPIKAEVEERIKKRSRDVLQKAAYNQVDLLVFPEMLGTDALVEQMSCTLDAREDILDNEFPRLTMCPTVWKQNCNECRVLDDMGETVCKQQKHHGVDLKVKQWQVKEDIKSDQKIYILHCHGIGRIAVAICKDFLVTSYLKILVEKLKANVLLVPSFTEKDYQFRVLAPKYGIQDCSVIWINSCSSRWLNEEGEMKASVTLAYLAGRLGIDKIIKSMDSLCKGNNQCDGVCMHTHRIVWKDVEVAR